MSRRQRPAVERAAPLIGRPVTATTNPLTGDLEIPGVTSRLGDLAADINQKTTPSDRIFTMEEAAHFARQVSIAPTWEEIQHIHKLGSRRKWIAEQISAPKEYPSWVDDGNGGKVRAPGIFGASAQKFLPPDTNDGTTDKKPHVNFPGPKYTDRIVLGSFLAHDKASMFIRQRFHTLELKATWVLSKFIVCSIPGGAWDATDKSAQIASWYAAINAHALGNFRDLLEEVTYNPSMGAMLTYIGNRKQTGDSHPDENYAREIMQLFTIGLWELNRDGTYKLDPTGRRIPTYDNEDIRQVARAMTGLVRWDRPDSDYLIDSTSVRNTMSLTPLTTNTAISYRAGFITPRMRHYPHFYEWGPKYALQGRINIPEGTAPADNLKMVHDALFNHPNCGPFVCKNLIKQSVTSNPSRAYVERVVAVFENNGEGVRGDMAAVWEAIFCDPEATNTIHTSPTHGRVRDGFEMYANHTRTFKCEEMLPVHSMNSGSANFIDRVHVTEAITGGCISEGFATGRQFGTWPALAPSIFGYYSPDNQPSDLLARDLVSPEIDVLSPTAINNILRYQIEAIGVREPGDTLAERFPTCRDYAEIVPITGTAEELVERLNLLMCGGTLLQSKKQRIIDWVASMPVGTEAQRKDRVTNAIQYVISSTEFMVM